MSRTAACRLAVLAALAMAAVPAVSASEAVSGDLVQASRQANSIVESVKRWFKEQKRRIKNDETVPVCPQGTAPSYEGDNGLVCRTTTPFSVTCKVLEVEPVQDEGGVWYRPTKTECTPSGGFAGPGTQPDPIQAP